MIAQFCGDFFQGEGSNKFNIWIFIRHFGIFLTIVDSTEEDISHEDVFKYGTLKILWKYREP